MTVPQMLGVLVLYLLGAAACSTWAVAEGWTFVLGLVLWTSFYGFCNAVGWALWWSREHWLP